MAGQANVLLKWFSVVKMKVLQRRMLVEPKYFETLF